MLSVITKNHSAQEQPAQQPNCGFQDSYLVMNNYRRDAYRIDQETEDSGYGSAGGPGRLFPSPLARVPASPFLIVSGDQ
jgi:hypothetical protein